MITRRSFLKALGFSAIGATLLRFLSTPTESEVARYVCCLDSDDVIAPELAIGDSQIVWNGEIHNVRIYNYSGFIHMVGAPTYSGNNITVMLTVL